MKRIVTQAGGRIVSVRSLVSLMSPQLTGSKYRHTASSATHIITSHDSLNASATHKFLSMKSKNKVYIVKPEWATESIKAGRRRPERDYCVIKDTTNKNLFDYFEVGKS